MRSSRGSVTSSVWSGLGCVAQRFERLRAFDARLAGRDAQIDELARAEEAEVRVRCEQRVPLEPGLGDEDFALVASGAPRRGADRIAGLHREQRLIAVNDIERRERALEVCGELAQPDFHGSWSQHRVSRTAEAPDGRPTDTARTSGFFADCSRRTICCTASVCISFSSFAAPVLRAPAPPTR